MDVIGGIVNWVARFFVSAPALAAFLLLPRLSAAELPNIVLILADDLGYGDLSAYGASGLTTRC